MDKLRVPTLLCLILLAGCVSQVNTVPSPPPSPTSYVTDPSTPSQTSPSPQSSPIESSSQPSLQLRISTSSDWTTLRLVGAADLAGVEIVSASAEAGAASYDQERLHLTQSIERAQSGDSVEMVVNLSLGYLPPDGTLDFEIDRGHIGVTSVEVYGYACGQPALVEELVWDGVRSSGENTARYEIAAGRLSGNPTNDYVVIAQLNFWYFGPGPTGGFEDAQGNRMTPLTPLLGATYWASDPEVVYQQIEWAAEYGVDAFSIEWTTPRGVGCCGSMEDTLDDVFLQAPNISKVRWAIFYDFVLRLDQTRGLKKYTRNIDFDEQAVYDTLVSDFRHFAEKYFGHPQYLTIDERPVIYIWASRAFSGDLEGALRDARQAAAELGFDVFIVGDEILASNFDRYHASLFDGNTTFTFLIGGLDWSTWKDVGDAVPAVDRTFAYWREHLDGVQVIDREEYVNFQPAWAPQYDDTQFPGGGNIYVPAASKQQVLAMAEVARKYAQPVGSQGQMLIWLNTWNNWAETTTVEPTAALGPMYPGGNYQFDFLEVVREVFGAETFTCGPG